MESSPATELVQQDMACFRCGYNLRNLPLAGRCPECGEVVVISQPGRHFSVADVYWRALVRLGAALQAAALIAVVVVLGSIFISDHGLDPVPLFTLLTLATTLWAVGAWLMATPEPGGPYYDDVPWLRRAVRFLACLAWFAMVSCTTIVVIEDTIGWSSGGGGLWEIITGIPAFGGSLLVTALLMWHLSCLAKRLNSRRLVFFGRLSAFSTPMTLAVMYGVAMVLSRVRAPQEVVIVLALSLYGGLLLWPATYALVWRYYAGVRHPELAQRAGWS